MDVFDQRRSSQLNLFALYNVLLLNNVFEACCWSYNCASILQAGVKGSQNYFKGRMACLQIYNRALNASELEQDQSCPVRE